VSINAVVGSEYHALQLCQRRDDTVRILVRALPPVTAKREFSLVNSSRDPQWSPPLVALVSAVTRSMFFDACSLLPGESVYADTLEVIPSASGWLLVNVRSAAGISVARPLTYAIVANHEAEAGRVAVYSPDTRPATFVVRRSEVGESTVETRIRPARPLPEGMRWTDSVDALVSGSSIAPVAYLVRPSEWRARSLRLFTVDTSAWAALVTADGTRLRTWALASDKGVQIDSTSSGPLVIVAQLTAPAAGVAILHGVWSPRKPPAPKRVGSPPRPVASSITIGRQVLEVRIPTTRGGQHRVPLRLPSGEGSLIVFAAPSIEIDLLQAGSSIPTAKQRVPMRDGRVAFTFATSKGGIAELVAQRSRGSGDVILRARWVEGVR
jgi:hypothetical protein